MYDTDEGAPVRDASDHAECDTTTSATRCGTRRSWTTRIGCRYPREYLEMVTIGACQKLARRDRGGPLAAEFWTEDLSGWLRRCSVTKRGRRICPAAGSRQRGCHSATSAGRATTDE